MAQGDALVALGLVVLAALALSGDKEPLPGTPPVSFVGKVDDIAVAQDACMHSAQTGTKVPKKRGEKWSTDVLASVSALSGEGKPLPWIYRAKVTLFSAGTEFPLLIGTPYRTVSPGESPVTLKLVGNMLDTYLGLIDVVVQLGYLRTDGKLVSGIPVDQEDSNWVQIDSGILYLAYEVT